MEERTALAALVMSILSLVFFIIGVPTNHWSRAGEQANFGLWRACGKADDTQICPA